MSVSLPIRLIEFPTWKPRGEVRRDGRVEHSVVLVAIGKGRVHLHLRTVWDVMC
jgi:hypothetical protein